MSTNGPFGSLLYCQKVGPAASSPLKPWVVGCVCLTIRGWYEWGCNHQATLEMSCRIVGRCPKSGDTMRCTGEQHHKFSQKIGGFLMRKMMISLGIVGYPSPSFRQTHIVPLPLTHYLVR